MSCRLSALKSSASGSGCCAVDLDKNRAVAGERRGMPTQNSAISPRLRWNGATTPAQSERYVRTHSKPCVQPVFVDRPRACVREANNLPRSRRSKPAQRRAKAISNRCPRSPGRSRSGSLARRGPSRARKWRAIRRRRRSSSTQTPIRWMTTRPAHRVDERGDQFASMPGSRRASSLRKVQWFPI